jgi:crotonobetainyl-CoA:carnitine CoA-transferase CaiB-like acyl-CoA transferase
LKNALKNIRVVDLTDSIVGPFVTTTLAGCGAEVIKIESHYHLGFRRVGPWGPKGDENIPAGPEKQVDFSKVDENLLMSPVFAQLNYNKKSILLNLDKPEARELLKKLIKMSDIVIDNLRFGIMQKWGLGYDEIKQIKDDIIVVSLQSLGKGPYQNWITWAMSLMPYTGFAYSWGHPDTPITERVAGRYYGDFISGSMALSAIMGALIQRDKTGKGQSIQLSQAEATTVVLEPLYLDYFVNNRITPPRGNRHPQFAPYNCYRCRGTDEWCVIAVFNEEEWQRFCHVLENTPWTRDPKFKDMESRLQNVEELDQNIERWTTQFTPHQIMLMLQYNNVAAGVVQTSEDMFYDVQLRERGHVFSQELPRLGKITFAGLPVHFSEGQNTTSNKTPAFGEHNDYVYRQLLGLTPEEIKKLEDQKIIY